jgi:hypothetical protein
VERPIPEVSFVHELEVVEARAAVDGPEYPVEFLGEGGELEDPVRHRRAPIWARTPRISRPGRMTAAPARASSAVQLPAGLNLPS